MKEKQETKKKRKPRPVAYMDDMEFYTVEQYKSFPEELRTDLIPLYKHPSDKA